MTEKTLKLDFLSLGEFLGIQNGNIKEVAKAYPQSKIISRGDEILLKGPDKEIDEISLLFNNLMLHFDKFGNLSLDNVKTYLKGNTEKIEDILYDKDIIVHGNRGLIVKARTVNQKRLVEANDTHDIVFAIGPAGTGKIKSVRFTAADPNTKDSLLLFDSLVLFGSLIVFDSLILFGGTYFSDAFFSLEVLTFFCAGSACFRQTSAIFCRSSRSVIVGF